MDRADVRFDPDTGLVPAVVQSTVDASVRMLGYMNAEALEHTLASGRVTFWSRSREELWEKGATSGHWLEVVEVRPDCDRDALLVRAVPHGPTCHTGARSCFAAAEGCDASEDRSEPVPDGSRELGEALRSLERIVARRDRERPADSYTTRLLEAGSDTIARKVGEEAVETVVAALTGGDGLAEESADLLYHLVVLWRTEGVAVGEVADVLADRRGGGSREQ